jgi:exodeoxyribonuclease V alpha subunit
VQAVVGMPGERKPLLVEGDWLYAERMRLLEERFCARIRERLASPALPAKAATRAVAAVASRAQLTPEQQSAVRDALRAPLTLVTGGPGTGKTTTVVALVRAIAWLGTSMDAVAIAAPTGKAAQRLADAVAAGFSTAPFDITEVTLPAIVPPPTTLHRLLGWSPTAGRFSRHENDPLAHRFVIVDEASMIDLAMMDRLLRALRADAHLILLGDADQLPSVEAGAVFRDLCATVPTSRLTRNLRVAHDPQAQRIVAAATAVNAGALDAAFEAATTARSDVSDLVFVGVEHLDRPWGAVGDALLERAWVSRQRADASLTSATAHVYRAKEGVVDGEEGERLAALYRAHQKQRILCVTRVARIPTSADQLNLQVIARLRARERPRGRGAWSVRDLEPGTPVLVTANHYARGLFNGDQGVVVRVDPGHGETPERMAAFPRGRAFVVFPVEAIPGLTPAYAMTVHKAQGSEFDHVTVVLPESDSSLLTRELVYTAMTRARRSVLLVGERTLLARAVSRTVRRHSGVAERLGKR